MRRVKVFSHNPIHHLLKTFYTGPGGWCDQQLFGALGQSTGEPAGLMAVGEESPHRDVMMPKRKQTREQDRRDRINQERRERTELIAEEERQRQAWLAENYQPPPS
jgi:hypothetical protein